MQDDIQVFNFKGAEVRTVLINGEPWFCGKDVAERLGYEAGRNAIANHVDAEDKLTHRFSASGQARDMTIINESGLYALIFGSKLPVAKEFKRWVTSEVLPALRKTGIYSSQFREQSPLVISAKTNMLRAENRKRELEIRSAKHQQDEKLANIKTLYIMASNRNIPLPDEARQALIMEAAKLITGADILTNLSRSYTAQEIADEVGEVTRIQVIEAAKEMGLLTQDSNKFCKRTSTAPHWVFNENGRNELVGFFRRP